jgi:SAM-dependent methyltransferase
LGPGQKRYLAGWINLDANLVTAKIDVWADLTNGLPFADSSVDSFYSHHVIEHLADTFLPQHFKELFRCLKPGGHIRVGGPNGDVAIERFSAGDSSWFDSWPDNRKSIGGRLNNFLLCRNEHLSILTRSWLDDLAISAGFTDIRVCRPGAETSRPDLIDCAVLRNEEEATPDYPHTLIIEAAKPSVPAAGNN